MRQLFIDGIEISDAAPCYVIAEIGHNHQGDVEQAKRLIEAAKECGVNAVKTQKRSNRALYTREFYEQPSSASDALTASTARRSSSAPMSTASCSPMHAASA